MLLWLSNLPNAPAGGGAFVSCLVGTVSAQAALSTEVIQAQAAVVLTAINATPALSADLEVCKKPVS